jgi:hypothetical protein
MRFLAFIPIIFIFSGPPLPGQVPEKDVSTPGVLSLRVKNINFFKNNEYFNPIKASDFVLISSLPKPVDKSQWIEGYTLPGFFIQPELVYQPAGKVTIRAGVHLLKYFGTNDFSLIKPVVSASLKLSEKTILTLGTLSGCDKHLLFDPDFDSERLYTNYSEDGFQLTSSNDHIFTDTWVNWENFIHKGDTTQEVFAGGESFKFTSSPVADIIHFIVPVQLQFKHFGGQISNYPQEVETFYNIATGLRINFDIGQKKVCRAGIEYLQFFNTVVSNGSTSEIKNGNASWLRLHFNYKALYIGAAYWKGHDFYAPEGNAIYASIYDFHSDYIIPDRKIITNYISISLLPESSLELFLGLQTYYDVCTKKMDNSITLHLNFDKLIRLTSVRN